MSEEWLGVEENLADKVQMDAWAKRPDHWAAHNHALP